MPRNLQGKLTIAKMYTNGADEDYVEIQLVDATSHTQCVTIRVALVEFTEALFSHSNRPCTFEWRPEEVGKQVEHKTELVPYTAMHPRGSMAERSAQHAALKPFEVDGWRGDRSDLGNRHRGSMHDGYRVRFTRYVAPEE